MTNVRHILDDIDYLVPLVAYLGSNPYWWARSAPSLAKELCIDARRVQSVFERYPMIFRKSLFIKDSNAHSYALQMRYAQRKDSNIDDPPQVSLFPVLSEHQVLALIEFLVKLSTLETTVRSSQRTAMISVIAAVIAAAAAIFSAFAKVAV